MKLLKGYLLKNYSQTFFPIFLTLYIITSIIFLVKIASLTSVIQMDFIELFQLYSYSIPTILFYTLPISTFVGLSLSLAKLSSEYELIVVTSFGFKPMRVIKLVLPNLILISIVLLIISLVLIPKAEYEKSSFLQNKKVEAQFNIKASEYGQEFGDWLIYVNDEKDGIYKDIVLFKKENNSENFIVAKSATMENKGMSLSLNLEDGKAVSIDEGIKQINYEKMFINNEIKAPPKIGSIDDIISYWQDTKAGSSKADKLSFYVLSSLFPILSILFAFFIGYFNPRYDKNRSTALAFVVTVIFIVAAHRLTKEYDFMALYSVPFVWIALSYIFYRIKVKPYY